MLLFAAAPTPDGWDIFWQHCLTGLTNGCLFALIALGYSMVYGIIELVNFAHGDLMMLGCFLALSMARMLGMGAPGSEAGLLLDLTLLFLAVPVFCAFLNYGVNSVVYRPLRKAPRLAPLVSAIGVSYVFMNIGMLWWGAAEKPFPDVLPRDNLLGDDSALRFTIKDLMVICVTMPLMLGLTLFVKFTKLGTAMRATSQDPIAAQLMGVPSERVISATFLIGGGLAGAGSVVYALYINTLHYQMGYQNGLFAFTAAVLGGIGKIPGAVLGALIIGMVRSLGSGYVSERWTTALIFAILIIILIFRPTGLLGDRRREKV